MKYIRTYGDYNSWKTDYSDPDRGFRLKPTLYKYSDVNVESRILLENDDPRKHGDSTYIKIYIDSDIEFSFYIGNKPGDTQTTMNCTIDWGDGVIEDKNITADSNGFKLSHSYTGRNFRTIELYNVERDYIIPGYDGYTSESLISRPSIVKNTILGNSVVSIGLGAFYYCESLTSVYIPESVVSIGNSAFYGCFSLTSVYIPKGVTSIGDEAFSGCTSLTSVHIPESVTSIGEYAFSNCSGLTSAYIPKSVTSTGVDVFGGCTSLTTVYISEGVTSIGGGIFKDCTSLTTVYIPEGVTSIGNDIFKDCTSLTTVYIPGSITLINSYAFENCSSLTSVYISEGVTEIGWSVFYNCSSLTSVYIPESATIVGKGAFSSCTSLTSISSLNTTAPTLGSGAFSDLPTNGTLYIKPGATGYDAWLNALPSGWKIVESL